MICSTVREKSDQAGRDTQFTVLGQLESKEVETLLTDPYQIHVLKQLLMQLSPEDVKKYLKNGMTFPDGYFQEYTEAFRAKYLLYEEDQESIKGMISAIVESAGHELLAFVLPVEEHTLYAALSCVPQNLRHVAFCAPCYTGENANTKYGVINLVPQNRIDYSDFPTGGVDRYNLPGIQKQKFYKTVCDFFSLKESDAELQKRFASPEFAQASSKDAAQAILRYCDVIEKQKEYCNARSRKEKERYLKDIQRERMSNPALDFLLPALLQESPSLQKEKAEGTFQQPAQRDRASVPLSLLEKITGILMVVAGVLAATVSKRQPEFIIRIEVNSWFLLAMVGVFWGGYFIGKGTNRRKYLRERSLKKKVDTFNDHERQL